MVVVVVVSSKWKFETIFISGLNGMGSMLSILGSTYILNLYFEAFNGDLVILCYIMLYMLLVEVLNHFFFFSGYAIYWIL